MISARTLFDSDLAGRFWLRPAQSLPQITYIIAKSHIAPTIYKTHVFSTNLYPWLARHIRNTRWLFQNIDLFGAILGSYE